MRFACPPRLLAAACALAGLAGPPVSAAPDPTEAAAVFRDAKAICARDAAALWGRDLCGPILLVDPVDRAVVANQADAGGVLKPSGDMFVGVLPASAILANTPVEWSGLRWTELLWPMPGDADQRQVTLAHELFHRIQPELGLSRPDGGNEHLDTLEGRYLLQLEWRALEKALRASKPAGRKAAVAEALAFRAERYHLFPTAAAEEMALEINEGVPEYTGVRLGLTTAQARTDYAIRDLSSQLSAPSFVRAFAYADGPAYGLLLDQADPEWRGKLNSGQGLHQLLAKALKLPEAPAGDLAARKAAYDPGGALLASEVKRDERLRAELAAYKAKLVDGPVLTLPLRGSKRQFRPPTLRPLKGYGIVYPTLRLSSDWGVLEVDGAALLNSATGLASVSAAGIDPSRLKGEGWTLSLKPGWTVGPGARAGDFAVVAEK